MMRTTRSRLEIRQEPGGLAAVSNVLLAALGLAAALAAPAARWVLPVGSRSLWTALLLTAAAACLLAGRVLRRRSSRVVVDLDHRMVARYRGRGAGPLEGNRSWDLADFAAVVLLRRERRRLLSGKSSRAASVCLRRADGLDLELYRARDVQDGAETAERVARFTGLPCLGPRSV